MKTVLPILIVPDGAALDEDWQAVSNVRQVLTDYFETQNRPQNYIHIMRPLAPACPYPKSYFFPDGWQPGDHTPWESIKGWLRTEYPPDAMAKALALDSSNDLIYLVFLQDFHSPVVAHQDERYSWWGIGGPMTTQRVAMRWCVVDYDVIDNLKEGALTPNGSQGNVALGIICHEIGHCLGYQHTPHLPNSLMWHYWLWPEVTL